MSAEVVFAVKIFGLVTEVTTKSPRLTLLEFVTLNLFPAKSPWAQPQLNVVVSVENVAVLISVAVPRSTAYWLISIDSDELLATVIDFVLGTSVIL